MATVITVLRRRKRKPAKRYLPKATQLVSDIAGFDSRRKFSTWPPEIGKIEWVKFTNNDVFFLEVPSGPL